MKYLIPFTLVFSFLFTTYACQEPLVTKEMVHFDKAFIPAYYYAYLGDLDHAEKAMIPLNRRWQVFKHRYVSPSSNLCEDWNESLHMIDAWIREANVALRDKDTFRAAAQLDHARYELMDLRWREDMEYYLDYVWDLEGSIGVAIDVSTDPMLDLLSWKDFYTISQTVHEAWQVLEKRELDATLYELKLADQLEWAKRKKRLDKAINHFLAAVEGADACQFAAAALQLEPVYLDFMAVFGDFESAQTYYARVGDEQLTN